MITQKLFKSGNSVVVAIPPEIRHELNWRDGTTVVLEKIGNSLVITAEKDYEKKNTNLEFTKWLEEFNAKYKDALEKLAKK